MLLSNIAHTILYTLFYYYMINIQTLYIEEAKEMYQAYLETYLQNTNETNIFYAENFPIEQNQLRTEEKKNIKSEKWLYPLETNHISY